MARRIDPEYMNTKKLTFPLSSRWKTGDRVRAWDRTKDDAYRCGHPKGGIHCKALTPCHACPFAELIDIEPLQAA